MQFIYVSILVFMSALLSAYLIYSQLYTSKLNALEFEHNNILYDAVENLLEETVNQETLLRLMLNDPVINRSLKRSANNIDVESLNREFVGFGKVVSDVMQVRWLDDQGYERARVDFKNSTVNVIPKDKLQDKSDRYYFRETISKRVNEVYFSPIDLNIENKVVVFPYEPTMRVAIHTGESMGLREGVFIVNFNLSPFFDQMFLIDNKRTILEIIDKQGFWLHHPDSAKEWGRDLGKSDENLSTDKPELWQQMQSNSDSYHLIVNGELVFYHKLVLNSSDEKDTDSLYFMTVSSNEAIKKIKISALWPSVVTSLTLFLIGCLLVYRDFRARLAVYNLSLALENEKEQLVAVNQALQKSFVEQKLIQEELVNSKKLAALGLTVAGVAHELNTPIGGALLVVTSQHNRLVELEREIVQGLTIETLNEFVVQSHLAFKLGVSNLTRAKSIVDSFKRLAFERSNDGLSEFQLDTLVDDLLRTLATQIKGKPFEIKKSIPANVNLYTDYGALSQVLENLISNSLQHGLDGRNNGIIWIDAKLMPANRIEIRIRDNGKGIHESIVSNIFEPFVTGARGSGHIGLGLHLVYQWVSQKLLGTLELNPDVDQGCEFIINLPLILPAGGVEA